MYIIIAKSSLNNQTFFLLRWTRNNQLVVFLSHNQINAFLTIRRIIMFCYFLVLFVKEPKTRRVDRRLPPPRSFIVSITGTSVVHADVSG